MRRLRVALAIVAAILAFLVVSLALASGVGGMLARRRHRAEKSALAERARRRSPGRAEEGAIERLPAPVSKYLETSGTGETRSFRSATLTQSGRIRTAPAAAWMRFESEQFYTFDPPGFIWIASVSTAGFVTTWARDSYVDGTGHMLVRLLGLFAMVDATGDEIDQGAALRYWGEIIMFRECVLDPRLRWLPLDDRSARLIIADGARTLQAEVEFGPEGYLEAVRAMRYRDVDGTPVLTRWSGLSTRWRRMGPRMFPTRWQSIWHLDDGDFVAVARWTSSASTRSEDLVQ